MKKQINFPNLEDTRLDDKIQNTMQREFPLPENVEAAKAEAFAMIREKQKKQEYANCVAEKSKKAKRSRRVFYRTCTAAAAAAAVFSGVCITNPAFAAQIPLVGHVFEELGQSLGFSGDFSEYARPLAEAPEENTGETTDDTVKMAKDSDNDTAGEEPSAETAGKELYSAAKDGMTVTLSEVYCNDVALYISMVLQTEDEFPETLTMQDENGAPVISLQGSTMKFSYNEREMYVGEYLDGRMVDDHTYAGVLRYDLNASMDSSDYEDYEEKKIEFCEGLGISREELEENPKEAYDKLEEMLGVDFLTDEAIAEAGGPDIADYKKSVEIPETFTVELNIPQIVGDKPDASQPEMPEDIRAEYEKAMTDNGLGLSDEDYENFTEEQKETEHQLFLQMWNAYGERYPETTRHPNQYMNWWVDGPWNFTFDVTKDDSQTVVKEINEVDENNVGLVSVTKTPFELTVEDSQNIDCFTVVLDADGDILPSGTFGGNANVMAVQDRDVSKVDVYICDYVEYMDELKGYYWSEDYEENKKTKTFKQLLDERALYHKEISFED